MRGASRGANRTDMGDPCRFCSRGPHAGIAAAGPMQVWASKQLLVTHTGVGASDSIHSVLQGCQVRVPEPRESAEAGLALLAKAEVDVLPIHADAPPGRQFLQRWQVWVPAGRTPVRISAGVPGVSVEALAPRTPVSRFLQGCQVRVWKHSHLGPPSAVSCRVARRECVATRSSKACQSTHQRVPVCFRCER